MAHPIASSWANVRISQDRIILNDRCKGSTDPRGGRRQLEAGPQRQTEGPGLDGVKVDVGDRLGFAWQLRLVQVRDVVVAAVEDVEQRRTQLDVVRDAIAGF